MSHNIIYKYKNNKEKKSQPTNAHDNVKFGGGHLTLAERDLHNLSKFNSNFADKVLDHMMCG